MPNSLDKLLANMRPATPKELKEQGESLARNYKPGPRQARPFPPTRMGTVDLVECVKRLLHGQELTVREADEIHALVRQNTRRGR